MTMQPEQWLTQVAKRFDKAATTYTQFNKTQHLFARRLYQRTHSSNLGDCLDLGCGPGSETQLLLAHCQQYLGVDPAKGMLAQASKLFPHVAYKQGSAENIPTQNAQFDTVFANFSLQWCPELSAVADELFRVTRSGGQVLMNTLLTGTFAELVDAYSAFDDKQHTITYRTQAEVEDKFRQAGFQVASEVIVHTDYFERFETLLRHIKGVGASQTPQQGRGLMTPTRWHKLKANYEQKRTSKGLPLTWKVLELSLIKNKLY
ncbi:MAG: methyltransferase domain-containing protein [Idiomarina sp.]|nr:methyltransferase domain-containing protein [Idiomarina sp.]